MRKQFTMFAALAACVFGASQAGAVELLTGGDFEPVGGAIPNWETEEFATGGGTPPDVITTPNFASSLSPPRLAWMRAFTSGGPIDSDFNQDNVVDGRDFIVNWLSNVGTTTGALQVDGNANPTGDDADGDVDEDDLGAWNFRFGDRAGRPVTGVLKQVVDTGPGNYALTGWSRFEFNYSGGETTLGAGAPDAGAPSPTTTSFKMEYLNGSGAVIGSDVLDVPTSRATQVFPGDPINDDLWYEHTLNGTAPTGTTQIRVIAEARDMVYNATAESGGGEQSAFFDDFALVPNGGSDILQNGGFDIDPPSGLDPFDITVDPESSEFFTASSIFRAFDGGFAQSDITEGPGNSHGLWISSFFGRVPGFDPVNPQREPVGGTASQTVPGQAGALYTFGASSMFEFQYSGGFPEGFVLELGHAAGQPNPANSSLLKLEFLDANGDVIPGSGAELDLRIARNALGTGDPGHEGNDREWYEHEISANSPVGTQSVRVSAIFTGGVSTDLQQSAFLDDWSLDGPFVSTSAVPEPTTVAMVVLGAGLLCLRRTSRGRNA